MLLQVVLQVILEALGVVLVAMELTSRFSTGLPSKDLKRTFKASYIGGSFQYPGGGFSWIPELHNRPVLGLVGACVGNALGLFWVRLFWGCFGPVWGALKAP